MCVKGNCPCNRNGKADRLPRRKLPSRLGYILLVCKKVPFVITMSGTFFDGVVCFIAEMLIGRIQLGN